MIFTRNLTATPALIASDDWSVLNPIYSKQAEAQASALLTPFPSAKYERLSAVFAFSMPPQTYAIRTTLPNIQFYVDHSQTVRWSDDEGNTLLEYIGVPVLPRNSADAFRITTSIKGSRLHLDDGSEIIIRCYHESGHAEITLIGQDMFGLFQSWRLPTSRLRLQTKSRGSYQSINGVEYAYGTYPKTELVAADECIPHELLDYYNGLALNDQVYAVTYTATGTPELQKVSLSGGVVTEQRFTKNLDFECKIAAPTTLLQKLDGQR